MAYMKKILSNFFLVLEPNHGQDPLSIFMKSIKISSKSDNLSSISGLQLKFLEAVDFKILPIQKNSQFFYFLSATWV